MMQNSNTSNPLPFHALIVAGGRGVRMGNGRIPKQYLHISGKAVLQHTIERFLNIPGLQSIKVVIHPDDQVLYDEAVKELNILPFTTGGSSRSASIYNGLKSFSNLSDKDIILIHDAARPCVSQKDVLALLKSLKNHRAATLACPVTDTLRHKSTGETINRDDLWAIQTPQGFRYEDIMQAHESASSEQNFTDDAAMVSALGIDVTLIESSRNNIKITMEDDIKMAEQLLSNSNMETRTGTGFDVHAFDLQNNNRKLILGGIEIPHTHGLKGHSDADVALHSITDALLGAMGEGDIGKHFPPSNLEFKNMDSAVFLGKACDILLSKGGSIINIDLTIICETPKIEPYRKQMQKRIAEILQLDESRINIKATTTEKLGFTGRGEGIATQAIANIKV